MAANYGVWVLENQKDDKFYYFCTACGHREVTDKDEPVENGLDRCPKCGAKMLGDTVG